MIFYLLFPLLIFVYVTACYKTPYTGVVVMFLMFFFSLFRGDLVGTDTMNYMEGLTDVVRVFYSKNSFFEDNNRYEYLYYLLCILIYEYGLSERFLITVFSLFNFYFLYLGAQKNNVNVAYVGVFYILTNMYYLSFNISRQFVAISICFYAIGFLREMSNKKYLFFLWIFIAFLLHKSAILCMLFYICRFLKFERNRIGKIILCSYLLFVIFPITSLLFKFLSIIDIPLAANILNEGTSYNQSIIGVLYKILSGVLLFQIYERRSQERYTDLNDNLFLLYIVAAALMAEGNLYFYRLKFNFMIVLCIYLSEYFDRLQKKKVDIYILYSLLLYVYTIRGSFDYHPYYMSFDKII